MIFFILVSILFAGLTGSAESLPDSTLRRIAYDQKLGSNVSPNLPFRDENGKPVRLADYFGKRPIILVLGYYRCPMLCTYVLNGLIGGLQDLPLKIGRDYDVIDVSIDPQETPALAAAKKRTYVARFGQPDAADGWHFLTGDEPAIRQLADEVGFRYVYDKSINQYAHPSGLTFLTSSGKVSHYLSGVVFSAADLRQSIADATEAKVGSPIEQLFLLCFCYSPITGKYSGLVLGVVRGVGLLVMAGLALFVVGFWRWPKNGAPRGGPS